MAATARIAVLLTAAQKRRFAKLAKAAGLSVLAHLEDLAARGLIVTDGVPSIDGRYRLAR